ncbi:MAG: LptF/LptG family permease [Aquificae bacterium]|nr:LptF/LptG family permease [Aquificota bacterium]
MKILYRYLSVNLVKYFLVLIGFFSIVIVSSQLLHLPSILYHTGFIKFLQILFFVNLSFFKYQLFFGVLISSLLIGYSLRENREIYAIYSAGISKGQLIKPVFTVSLLFTVVALLTSLFLVPYANRERAQFITINVKKHVLDAIVEKNFMKLSEDITIYVQGKKENEMEKIFIFQKDKGITITAEKSLFSNNRLLLQNGYIQIPSQEGFNLLKFDKYRFILDIKYIKKYEFEDLDNRTLLEMVKSSKKNRDKALAVLSERVVFAVPFLFLGVLGFSLGLQVQKSREFVIGLAVILSIVYMVMNTYLLKLLQKGSINPVVYAVAVLVYFGFTTYYFYRKE